MRSSVPRRKHHEQAIDPGDTAGDYLRRNSDSVARVLTSRCLQDFQKEAASGTRYSAMEFRGTERSEKEKERDERPA